MTVAFDFDGVIHSYISGWKGADIIPDPPVSGICDVIRELYRSGYEIVVYTTRAETFEGTDAVWKYLEAIGIDGCISSVTFEKPLAFCYVDDRAIRFDGKTEGLTEKIISFKAWWEKEETNE